MGTNRIPVAILFTMLVTCSLSSSPASALTVDSSLAAALSAKASGERVPVLLVFSADNRVAHSLRSELEDAKSHDRRRQVLLELRENFAVIAADAIAILKSHGSGADAAPIRELYLAGALSFEADANLVARLATVPGDGTMFHDNARVTLDARRDMKPAAGWGVAGSNAILHAVADTAWGVKWIGANRVWNLLGYDGNGVVIGHIDSGVGMTHPDLADRIWTNPGEIAGNGIDDDGNGFVDDWRGWDFGDNDNDPTDDATSFIGGGHGTHTAGTIVGDGTDSVVTGVAPGAKLMPVKVWINTGDPIPLALIWAAQQYCVENGARVISMSLGVVGVYQPRIMRAERANAANIRDAGVLLVCSAGNTHGLYTYPLPPYEISLTASAPAPWNSLRVPWSSLGGTVAVGGTAYKLATANPRSSQGPVSWGHVDPFNDWPYQPGPGLTKPDLAAPGTNVNSTIRGGGYSGDTWSGTSVACPHVAGVAALMLQKNPSLSPAGLDSLMELTANDLGDYGKDNVFGSGLVNAYRAVQAVPTVLAPDLVVARAIPDPAGNGVLTAGGAESFAFSLRNSSSVVPATGVEATLAIAANPWVTVVDGAATFPPIEPGGVTADNALDPFRLHVAPEAPQDFAFTMILTVRAGGVFQRTFDVGAQLGHLSWRTHDMGGMRLTVTGHGTLGYLADDGCVGDGLGYRGGDNVLYIGSFWAGTDVLYICNRDFPGTELDPDVMEWRKSTAPDGGVRELEVPGPDQTFFAAFNDSGHAAPKPLVVEQTSLAFALPRDDRFVVLQYRLINQGPITLPALHTGVFCDFDIGSSRSNRGATDATRNLTYIYREGGPYYGIALLGPEPARNLTLIDNGQYLNPTYAISDTHKLRHLRGAISTPAPYTTGDWSALTSYTVSLDADGGEATVAYAIVHGATLSDLQAATDAARALYSPVVPVTDEVPAKVLRLDQNHPNPFNPATTITYEIARDGQVRLDVFDLGGRLVRTLVEGSRTKGAHQATWDGRDDEGRSLPSGTYICRMSTGGRTAGLKMTLVR